MSLTTSQKSSNNFERFIEPCTSLHTHRQPRSQGLSSSRQKHQKRWCFGRDEERPWERGWPTETYNDCIKPRNDEYYSSNTLKMKHFYHVPIITSSVGHMNRGHWAVLISLALPFLIPQYRWRIMANLPWPRLYFLKLISSQQLKSFGEVKTHQTLMLKILQVGYRLLWSRIYQIRAKKCFIRFPNTEKKLIIQRVVGYFWQNLRWKSDETLSRVSDIYSQSWSKEGEIKS